MPSESVWLGAPLTQGDADLTDAFVSKIGGKATLLRVCPEEERGCPSAFMCPKCKSVQAVSLLAQLYAPLECYDRVLYILTCSSCGTLPGPKTEGAALSTAPPLPATTAPPAGKRAAGAPSSSRTSFCFAVRSQNFNQEYCAQLAEERRLRAEAAAAAAKATVAAATAARGDNGLLFKEADDWGADGWSDEPEEEKGPLADTAPTGELDAHATEEQPLQALQKAFPLARKGTTVPLKGRLYTGGLPLNLFLEPERHHETLGSIEEQLEEAKRRYGVEAGTLDTTSFEEDDETPAEKVVRKYVERIELCPSQCVRWCPGDAPLRCSLMPSLQAIPPCPYCRCPRRYECQLTAPAVYYLTKDIGESRNADLHFGNVLVFTCSKNCHSGGAYLAEHVVVEDEI